MDTYTTIIKTRSGRTIHLPLGKMDSRDVQGVLDAYLADWQAGIPFVSGDTIINPDAIETLEIQVDLPF